MGRTKEMLIDLNSEPTWQELRQVQMEVEYMEYLKSIGHFDERNT